MTRDMWITLLLAILIFSVAFTISIVIVTGNTRKNTQIREAETIIHAVTANITANVTNYKDISRLVMLNEKVTNFLKSTDVDAGIINDAKYGIMDVLNVSSNLDSVFIFRNDGAYVSTGRAGYEFSFSLMDSPEWQAPILEKRGGALLFMNANDAIHHQNGDEIITIARAIYDIYSQEQTGILLINISTKMLDMIVHTQGKDSLCILSDTGTYLAGNAALSEYFSPDMERGVILHEKRRDMEKMISSYAFEDMPLVILYANSAKMDAMPRSYVLVFFLLLTAFVMVILISSHVVARSLNSLFGRLLDKEKALQKAEMRVLHEQIKPHFLYNSLSTISYMAYEAGATNVYEALETLGNFYRNFLSKGDREITVEKEVRIVRDYLSLQKLRYGDIIRDEYEIADSAKGIHIPKLLLQPLVENCIYHGIRPKGEEGVIRISADSTWDKVIISVYDNGLGMTPEEIRKVLAGESKDDDATEDSYGFGLRGTIDRIRYYTGQSDVVTIESEKGEYTKVTFFIPINADFEGANNVQSNVD